MARASGLRNVDGAKAACIERVAFETPNDERDPKHYDIPLSAHVDFPYVRTRAGVLQSETMPWDYSRRQSVWGWAGALSLALAVASKVV